MANGSTRYIIKYVGDISDVIRKLRILRRETANLGRGGARNLAPLSQQFNSLNKPLNATTKAAGRTSGSLGGLLVRAIKVIPVWIALRAVVQAFTAVLRSGISFLIQWEFQLAQIRIVGEATEGQIQTLSQGLLNLQRTLGISNKDLGEGAKLFRQQGRAIEEIIPLLDATSKLSLITGRNVTQSVEDLTAILKAFNIEARDSITIVDRLTAVTLQNAITAGDLASALRQSASTASVFGVELDELIGFITAIQTQTRDTGNTVGRALRTIFVRLGTVAVDTATQIAKVPFFLNELGEVTEQRTPRLRNLTAIITELAASFQTLESAEAAELSKAVGGIRRANQLNALFQNFNQFISAQIQAQFGLGEADRAIGIVTQTTVSKIEQVKGAWNALLDTFADTGVFRSVLDDIKNLLDTARFLIDPDQAVSTSLIAQLGADVQDFTRQATGIQGIFKEIENLTELNESLRRKPDDNILLGFSIARVNELRSAIAAFENQNNIDLGIEGLEDVRNTFDLLELLEGNVERLSNLFVDISVRTNVTEAQQQLVSVVNQVRTDLDRAFGSAVSQQQALFGDVRASENLPLAIIRDALRDLANSRTQGRAIANIEQIRSAVIRLSTGLDETDAENLLNSLDQLVESQEKNTAAANLGRNAAEEQLRVQERLKNEAIVEGEVKVRLLEIELDSIRIESDRLSIVERKLALLNNTNAQLSLEQQQIRDNLTLEQQRLEIADEVAIRKAKENEIIQSLKRNGASQLQIEIQKLAILRAQNRSASPEVVEQESRIRILAADRELAIQKQLIGLSGQLFSIEGARRSEIISQQIELENKLNIEKDSVTQLKDQLNLLKALKSEQESITREQGLGQLQEAVIQARRDQSPAVQARLDARESRLTQQAVSLGLDPEDFLASNNEELINETERNIIELQRNIDSTALLTGAIQSLTAQFIRQESRLSTSQLTRATIDAATQTLPAGIQQLSPLAVSGQSVRNNLTPGQTEELSGITTRSEFIQALQNIQREGVIPDSQRRTVEDELAQQSLLNRAPPQTLVQSQITIDFGDIKIDVAGSFDEVAERIGQITGKKTSETLKREGSDENNALKQALGINENEPL